MTTRTDHPLVVDWLARLDAAAAAAGVPVARRTELVAELRAHLADSLPDGADDAAVRTVLDRLGEPDDVVAAEMSDAAASSVSVRVSPGASPWGALEVVAVLTLGLSGVVLPILGPVLGLVLVHRSTAWARSTLRWATVLTLGWLALVPVALLLGVVAARMTGDVGIGVEAGGTFWQVAPILLRPAELVVLVLVLQPLGAVAAAALLALRIRRSPEPGLAGSTVSG